MQLTDDQKREISDRLAQGAGIADIQRLINDEFKEHMTYMEVRFLLDDLQFELAPPPAPKEEEAPAAEAGAGQAAAAKPANAELVQEVEVEIDAVKRPGAALSGTVTFSDGVGAKWYVDSYGRLGLDPDQEGYQPSEEDIQKFQMELQSKMQGPI